MHLRKPNTGLIRALLSQAPANTAKRKMSSTVRQEATRHLVAAARRVPRAHTPREALSKSARHALSVTPQSDLGPNPSSNVVRTGTQLDCGMACGQPRGYPNSQDNTFLTQDNTNQPSHEMKTAFSRVANALLG